MKARSVGVSKWAKKLNENEMKFKQIKSKHKKVIKMKSRRNGLVISK